MIIIAPGWLLGDERRLLHRYRRIGHDVRVATGVTVPVALTVCVQVQPDYIAGYVRAAVLQVPGGKDIAVPVEHTTCITILENARSAVS